MTFEETIKYLKKREKTILASDRFTEEDHRERALIHVTRDITNANRRLTEYQAQLKGRN